MSNSMDYEREIDYCKAEIKNYNSEINSNNSLIIKLEEEYEKHCELKVAVNKVGNKLENFENGRNSKCNELSAIANVTFAKQYTDSMISIKNGVHRKNAYNCIDSNIEEIKRKIRDIVDRIDDLKDENRRYYSKIEDNEYRIRQLRNLQKNSN